MAFEHKKHNDCDHCDKRFTNIICNPQNDSLGNMNREKVCSQYKKGEVIFKEGSFPYGVYCVNFGKIKLTKQGADGKEHIVRLIKEGDPMGYRSLLSGDKYSASAVAIEDCGVCFIPKELFLGILQKDSSLTMEMLKLLSDDLRKAEVQITHLAQKPVRERLAESLLFIKETYGFEEDGETINALFSREDIANIVGTATETAIRLLSELNKDNVIQLKGKKISILNFAKLVKIANIVD